MHSCSTCSVQKAPAAELSVGLRQLAVPQQRFAVQTTEATADVHKFLCKFHKLAKQRGCQPHTKAYHRWRQQQVWTVLSARQKLAYSLAMLIVAVEAVCQQTMCIAAVFCCVLPIAQLLWSACPVLGMSQLISNPDQRFFTPLADAVCFRYGALLLLSPTQHKYYRMLQWALTLVAVARIDMVSSFTILLVMALWAVNYLVAEDSVTKNMEPDEREHVYKMAAQHSGVPWLLPVHRMLPSASLIAILLIIGGVEVNPGPVISFVLTLLMLVTMPTARRTMTEGVCY